MVGNRNSLVCFKEINIVEVEVVVEELYSIQFEHPRSNYIPQAIIT